LQLFKPAEHNKRDSDLNAFSKNHVRSNFSKFLVPNYQIDKENLVKVIYQRSPEVKGIQICNQIFDSNLAE
jgi:hypothetical protein